MENPLGMKWTISGGIVHRDLILKMLTKWSFLYNINEPLIDTVHDVYPGLKWQGGRPPSVSDTSIDSVKPVWMGYALQDVGFNIIFNNLLVTEKDLDDEYCNYLLQLLHYDGNGVIVATDVLRDYIRSNYPKYNIIASCCNGTLMNIDDYKELTHCYDLVVLEPNHNRDLELIKQLDVSKIEVLVNQPCVANCNHTYEHYRQYSELALKGKFVYKTDQDVPKCIHKVQVTNPNEIDDDAHMPLYLSYKDMDNLRRIGITHFKLAGRDRDANTFSQFLNRWIFDYTIGCMCHKSITGEPYWYYE